MDKISQWIWLWNQKIKGKDNKLVDALSRRVHVAAISMHCSNLKGKFLEVVAWYIHYA